MFNKDELTLLAKIYELKELENREITIDELANDIIEKDLDKTKDNTKITRVRKQLDTTLKSLKNKGALNEKIVRKDGAMYNSYDFAGWNEKDLAECIYYEQVIPAKANKLMPETIKFLERNYDLENEQLISLADYDVYQLARMQKILKDLYKNELVVQDYIDKATRSGSVLRLSARGKSIMEYIQDNKVSREEILIKPVLPDAVNKRRRTRNITKTNNEPINER